MAGLYIHVPFCKQACHYCDFHFSTQLQGRKEMCEAIAQELRWQVNYLEGEPLETIYFGGGTPSLLLEDELDIIFSAIRLNYSLVSDAEITLEANPDDLNKDSLVKLRKSGVNRLSIGIQSFEDEMLQFFNRAHTAKQGVECIALARESGFDNLSLDLMYAVPGQDIRTWKKNVEQAIAVRPEHISAYSLTIENKTAFGQWLKKGKLQAVEEHVAAADFELLMDKLADGGYEHYEISNFCKPNFYSKHNSSYWKQKKYLGIGPSAHSYNGTSRQHTVSNNQQYVKSIQEGQLHFELENLTIENKINEYLFTTLRTQWGCDLAYLKSEFSYEVLHHPAMGRWRDLGLITLTDSVLLLTRKGKLLADQIAMELFASS